MKEERIEKKESNPYFEERIKHIQQLRSSGLSAKNIIKSLVSIADDFNTEDANSLPLKNIYDLQLLCDTMMDIAEKRMSTHEIMIFEEFTDFIELFREKTIMQKSQAEEQPDFIKIFEEIERNVGKLKSKFFEMEKAVQKKDYYQHCLENALCTLEQLDQEKRNLELELSDKPKEVEERVLKNLIEIAKNKSLSTRQGIKSLLLDYMSKNNISISSSDFQEKLATLDDELAEPKTVVNGDYVSGNKHVGNEVNNVAAGGTGIQVNK